MTSRGGDVTCLIAAMTLAGCFADAGGDGSAGTDSGTSAATSDTASTDTTSTSDTATTDATSNTASTSTGSDSDSDSGSGTSAGTSAGTTSGTTDGTTGGSTGGGSSGGITCGAGETDCNGVCVDTTTDVDHCGACDDPCVTGSCAASICEPVVLSTGNGRLFMVEVDGQYVYFGGDGVDIKRIGKDGTGEVTLVDQTNEYAYDHALTSTALVWGSDWAQPAGVRGCSTPDCVGGAGEYVAGSNLTAMVYADGVLYFNQGPILKSKGWPNGSVNDFATNQGTTIRAAAADDTYIYWYAQTGANAYAVRKKSQAGGTISTLASNLTTSQNEIAAGPGVLYIEGDNNELWSIPLPNGVGGAAPNVFADSAYGEVERIVTDTTDVYWTARAVNGAVHRCPHTGCQGAPDVLVETDRPWGITQDADAIYYVTEAGVVGMIPKVP